MRYKDFYVRITPDRSIQRVGKKGNEILCKIGRASCRERV